MKETRNYYTTLSNYTDHTTFGGNISNCSFNAHTTMSDIASQIISSWKFDQQCKRNAENRDEKKIIQRKEMNNYEQNNFNL